MAVLQLKGVSKRYGDRVILREADLVLEPGQRIGVVGVNGSGKSTLLRIAAGTEVADQGEVYRSHDVAYLEQEPLLPGLTVGESADLALSEADLTLSGFSVADSSSFGDTTGEAWRSVSAGDVNDDGVLDLAIGVGTDGSTLGAAFLYFGAGL